MRNNMATWTFTICCLALHGLHRNPKLKKTKVPKWCQAVDVLYPNVSLSCCSELALGIPNSTNRYLLPTAKPWQKLIAFPVLFGVQTNACTIISFKRELLTGVSLQDGLYEHPMALTMLENVHTDTQANVPQSQCTPEPMYTRANVPQSKCTPEPMYKK